MYQLFEEAADELEKYPNVIVIRSQNTLSWVDTVIKSLINIEISTPEDVARYVFNFAKACDALEATQINLTLYDDGSFKLINESVLDYEGEREYYDSVMIALKDKINDELSGKNEYAKSENISSRRFVYADTSCISFAQFCVRDDILDCHFVMRSANVKDTLMYDLPFLYILCSNVYNQLCLEGVKCRIRVNFNSAHIII